MASFRKRGDTWRAEVVRNGRRVSRTFATKAAAQQWATVTEAELLADKRGEIPRKTVRQALERYAAEVSPKKRGERWELLRLAAFGREKWADFWLTDLDARALARWRDHRLQAIKPASVRRDVNLLRAVFRVARREWRWLDHDPLDGFDVPEDSPERTRRVSWREVRQLCRALGYPGSSKSAEVARAFLVGLRTAMRAGEIIGLKPADVDLERRVARLAMTKNGDAREVPLSRAAVRTLRGWSGWSVDVRSVDALFRKARARCGIDDLHFHDSRAEALTRMSRKVDALTLARISGHRDLKILLRRYYRATAEEIARQLG